MLYRRLLSSQSQGGPCVLRAEFLFVIIIVNRRLSNNWNKEFIPSSNILSLSFLSFYFKRSHLDEQTKWSVVFLTFHLGGVAYKIYLCRISAASRHHWTSKRGCRPRCSRLGVL